MFTLTGSATDLDLDVDKLPSVTVASLLPYVDDNGSTRLGSAKGVFINGELRKADGEPWVIAVPPGTPLELRMKGLIPARFVAPEGELDLVDILQNGVPLPVVPTSGFVRGASAYDLAVEDGFEGTLEEWLATLGGIPGPAGEPGPPGADSTVPGPEGRSIETVTDSDADGIATITYTDGSLASLPLPRGLKGDTGAAGADGRDGLDSTVPGPPGEQGIQGIPGERGAQGPAGPAGMEWRGIYDPSTDYIDGDAVYFNGGSWFAAGDPPVGEEPSMESTNWNPLAIQGLQGPIGQTGSQGIQGIPGERGLPGEKGDKGDTGSTGPKGSTGASIVNATFTMTDAVYVKAGTSRFPVLPNSGTLTNVTVMLGTAGTSNTVVTLKRNGTTLKTLTLTSGATSAEDTTPVSVDSASLAYLTVDVTTAGAGAKDLVLVARMVK